MAGLPWRCQGSALPTATATRVPAPAPALHTASRIPSTPTHPYTPLHTPTHPYTPLHTRTHTYFNTRGLQVLASYGHVRDLPPKAGSVRPPPPAADTPGDSASTADPAASATDPAAAGSEAAAAGVAGEEEDWYLDWQVLDVARPRMAEIAGAATGAPLLVLATDPDREGEAISWHISQELEVGGGGWRRRRRTCGRQLCI